MQTVWVTGASSGLGLHTAAALRRAGYRVIAGARSFAAEERRIDEDCLPLDVTNEESIAAFVEAALARAGVPDVLVNCAGMSLYGPCETYALSELRYVMETNFFGQAAVIAQVLPLMRQQGKGRIVNFSSINGLLGVPYQGIYTATKHAVEGFSECLAMETRPFGIEVMVVEPGDHWSGSKQYRRSSQGVTEDSPYYASCERGIARITYDEEHGSDPDRLGEKIAKALQKKRLPRVLRVAMPSQHLAVVLHDVLPLPMFERILSSYYDKKLNK